MAIIVMLRLPDYKESVGVSELPCPNLFGYVTLPSSDLLFLLSPLIAFSIETEEFPFQTRTSFGSHRVNAIVSVMKPKREVLVRTIIFVD